MNKILLFILCFGFTGVLEADLLDQTNVYRVTVVFNEKKEFTRYSEKTGTLLLNLEKTTIAEVSEVVIDDNGNREIRTRFEPYDKIGFNYIKSCSVVQDDEKKSLQVRYILAKSKDVRYQILFKEQPYRLIIDFWIP